MNSVRRSEAHQKLMELLVGLPAWEADRVRDAVAAFEDAIMEDGYEEQRDSDRALTQLTVREALDETQRLATLYFQGLERSGERETELRAEITRLKEQSVRGTS